MGLNLRDFLRLRQALHCACSEGDEGQGDRERAKRLLRKLAPFDQWIKTTGAVEASKYFGNARKFYEKVDVRRAEPGGVINMPSHEERRAESKGSGWRVLQWR